MSVRYVPGPVHSVRIVPAIRTSLAVIFKAQYGYLISDVRCTVQCVVRNRLKSHGSRLASVIIYMVHFGRPRSYTRALFDCYIPDVGPRMAVITDERHIMAVSYLV